MMVLPGGEDQGVLHEAPIGVLLRHGELAGVYSPNQDRFTGAHRQGEDVTGIFQGERLTKGFELEALYQIAVRADII
jgi:hypothetical protein